MQSFWEEACVTKGEYREWAYAFYQLRRELSKQDALRETITVVAAPTLAGEKPATIMTFSAYGNNTLQTWHDACFSITEQIELSFIKLFENDCRAQVMFYDENAMEVLLYEEQNIRYLSNLGYDRFDLDSVLQQLILRFQNGCPDEIGLFLGIPLPEIKEYIARSGKDCLFCGYWKVYKDPQGACVCFQKYDQCKIGQIQRVLETYC